MQLQLLEGVEVCVLCTYARVHMPSDVHTVHTYIRTYVRTYVSLCKGVCFVYIHMCTCAG